MKMTSASSQYFSKVAGEWDSLRSGYFSEEVRTAAIRKAYVLPEMIVADVGAGTGFMAAGLAPLVQKVYLLDGSDEMLQIARQNLQAYDNLVFHQADGAALPLPDACVDAVFANMYLHHCPDPLAAIQEMARLLKPGGRLVITDLDRHPYEWLKEEMADVWMGFERTQIRQWFEATGLVNVIVDCTGESCSAQAQNSTDISTERRKADISVFVATGTRRIAGVEEAVRSGYGAAAQGGSSCCTPGEAQVAQSSCCDSNMDQLITISDDVDVRFVPGYSPDEQQAVPDEAAEIALGCGNPTAFAGLQPGETVLDIGSGGGMDAFLAARQVGPTGRVIGVDMTPAMLERARRAAQRAGLAQVEFRHGQAHALPVEDGLVDVIISNCVINLCEDKGRVFREAFRVLKAGGRLEVSDMVTDRPFPLALRSDPAGWPGCVYGALPEAEYLDLVAQAGFIDIHTHRSSSMGDAHGVQVYSLQVSARKPTG